MSDPLAPASRDGRYVRSLEIQEPDTMFDHKRLFTALAALKNYEQADMDGVMVTTSRQAIHEVAEAAEKLSFIVRHVELTASDALPPSSPEAAAAGGGFDPYNP